MSKTLDYESSIRLCSQAFHVSTTKYEQLLIINTLITRMFLGILQHHSRAREVIIKLLKADNRPLISVLYFTKFSSLAVLYLQGER